MATGCRSAHYLINVAIGGAGGDYPQQTYQAPTDNFAPADSGDIWSTGTPVPDAVDRKLFTDDQRRSRRQMAPDPLQNFMELPRYVAPAPAPGDESPFGNGPGRRDGHWHRRAAARRAGRRRHAAAGL